MVDIEVVTVLLYLIVVVALGRVVPMVRDLSSKGAGFIRKYRPRARV